MSLSCKFSPSNLNVIYKEKELSSYNDYLTRGSVNNSYIHRFIQHGKNYITNHLTLVPTSNFTKAVC